jgi:chromosome segregation ATPase
VTTLQVLAREVAVAKPEKKLLELKKLHEALQAKAQHLEQQQQQLKAQAEAEQQQLTTQTQRQQHLAQQEQLLHARSVGLDVREKQISASATLLAARQQEFNKQLKAQAEAEQQRLTTQNQRQQHLAQQEQQLHARTVGLDVRERQVSAATTLLAARQHDFNKSYQPLSADLHSRLQQVAAREQQLNALQAQLGAQSQSLAMREQQLRQTQGVQQQAAQVPYTYPYGHPGSYR